MTSKPKGRISDHNPTGQQVCHVLLKWDESSDSRFVFDLYEISGTEVFYGDHSANSVSERVHGGQANQVGVIIFAFFQRRQLIAIDFDQRAA